MAFAAPIGISDFQLLRQSPATYVDKTGFVSAVLATQEQVLLFPRPRRFGKTLNLSTLRYFLERSDEDRSALFEGLQVWGDERARAHFGRYPVIFLTLKDVKHERWEDCRAAIARVVANRYRACSFLVTEGVLKPDEVAIYEEVVGERASNAALEDSLARLSAWLHRATGERVVILIDEYDTPIHAAYTRGYYPEAITFFRNFLSAALKDNSHLRKGVVTGILRVAKESIFSGLNNLAVYTLLSHRFATDFGFTEDEVAKLAAQAGAEVHLDDIRTWYDGYLFGGRTVYNPWSVLSFLSRPEDGCKPYWVGTSSDELLRELLVGGGLEGGALEALLRGESIERKVEENIVLRDLALRPEAVWSLLLFSGYLKASDVHVEGEITARLSIPNQEVATAFRTVFSQWMQAGLGGGERVREMLQGLLAGDDELFEAHLERLLLTVASFHDMAGRNAEAFYQAFILGLLVQLEPEYDVRSNRESGRGRADVLVMPRKAGRPGAVLELKSVNTRRNETPEQAMQAALAQLRDRDYAAELRARGAAPIHQMAAVFDGEQVRVQRL